MIPFTRQHVRRLEDKGKFPRRLTIGNRRIGWLYTEIEDWVEERAALRKPTPPAE